MLATLCDQKILAAQSPVVPFPSNHPTKPNENSRRPLQPKNIPSSPKLSNKDAKSKPDKVNPVSPTVDNQFNKENLLTPVSPATPPPSYSKKETEMKNEPVLVSDASLAEELNEVRKRLERLRCDREATEARLKEKDRIFQVQMGELLMRGEFQKEFEMEVDRLYRLKQLQVKCMRMSPIRSLRERELGKKNVESPSEVGRSSRWEHKVELSNTNATVSAGVVGTPSPTLIHKNSRVIVN